MVLPAVPSGVGHMGQQTPAVGKDASVFLRLCPAIHAAPVCNAVLWPEQIRSDLGDRFLFMSLTTLRMCPLVPSLWRNSA